MVREYRKIRPLRQAPAQERARAGITRLLGSGSCLITPEGLAEIVQISTSSAQTFLRAGSAAGLFMDLDDLVGSGPRMSDFGLEKRHSGCYVITEKFPGAPSRDVIELSALSDLATPSGKQDDVYIAFAYHSALVLHGLSEVSPNGIHLIKVRSSIHPPMLPSDAAYQHRPRAPKQWRVLFDKRPVWMTLTSMRQVPRSDIVILSREGMPLPVTSKLRTLIDAWMHPDWCGGEDRVADSWSMYWRDGKNINQENKMALANLLASTTWPGLWRALITWSSKIVPDLADLLETIDKMTARR